MLNDLIITLGLDKSLFYQIALAIGLYFALKKWLFQPYLEAFRRREELTKGRLQSNKALEEEIEKKKNLYEQKARQIHRSFQQFFGRIKQKAEEHYLKETLKIKTAQKERIKKERQNLKIEMEKQEENLKKDFPTLLQLLKEKIQS